MGNEVGNKEESRSDFTSHDDLESFYQPSLLYTFIYNTGKQIFSHEILIVLDLMVVKRY